MGKDIQNIVAVLWRWKWIIIAPVAITLALLGSLLVISPPAYAAVVTLQVTTPDREDISIEDVYTWTSDRDEVTIAGNTFVEVAKRDIVVQLVNAELGLPEDYEYDLSVASDTGSDLVTIEVLANEAQLAADIANLHAEIARQQYGIDRSLPSTEALTFFQTDLDKVNAELAAAEAALLEFRNSHGIVDVNAEIERLQSLLTELETQRDGIVINNLNNILLNQASSTPLLDTTFDVQLLELDLQIKQNEIDRLILERDVFISQNAVLTPTVGGVVPIDQSVALNRRNQDILSAQQDLADINESILELRKTLVDEERALPVTTQLATVDVENDLLPQVDALIEEQRSRLNAVAILEPEYSRLVSDVTRMREDQVEKADKVEQATSKKSFTELVTFLQITSPAGVPSETDGSVLQTIILGLVGSIGLGLLLAFFMDYFFGGPGGDSNRDEGENQPYVSVPSPVTTAAADAALSSAEDIAPASS